MTKSRWLCVLGFLIVCLALPLGMGRWARAQVFLDPYTYFPSATANDSRMVSLSSTDVRSLAGQTLEFDFTAPPEATSFELGIFDGDTGLASPDATHTTPMPHWDLGSSELQFTLEADIEGFRTLIGQWRGNDSLGTNGVTSDLWASSSAAMPDNDWWNATIYTSEDARLDPADPFRYHLTIEMLDTTSPQQVSNFKLRTTADFRFRNSSIGVEAALRQIDSDGPIIYPGWNPSQPLPNPNFFLNNPTTYNGTFSFFVNVEAGTPSLAIFDGDLDYGTNPAQLTGNPSGAAIAPSADTDDPDTLPGERPTTSSSIANNEGAAGMGVPADDINFDRFRRSPSPYVRIIDPDGNVYKNDNPSGNLEWERFRVAKTGAYPANQSDYTVDNFAAGVWRIDVRGLDLSNLSYFHFNEDVLGVPAYLIGDTVFYDNNGNGVQDPGDAGIANVLLNLRKPGNPSVQLRALTDPAGYYDFPVRSGTWLVEIDPRNFQTGGPLFGLHATTASPVQSNTVTNRNILTYDFGFNVAPQGLPNSLGDTVWHDLNRNGIQDGGEPGIDGVNVQLFRRTAQGDTLVSSTTTAADPDNPSAHGFYMFPDLEDGTYYVKVTPPAGYVFTGRMQGGDPDVDSNADASGQSDDQSLAGGENNFTVDAGVHLPVASLGDFAWIDTDRDGVQDAGEPGLAGVTVELLSGATVVATQTTSGTGAYFFDNLTAGTYYVRFTPPAGYLPTSANAGGDDSKDSDADGGTGITGAYTLTTGTSNLTVDAGFYGVASLGDFAWNDVNRNGVQDNGETGLAGVTVTLLDGSGNVVGSPQVTGPTGAYLFTNLAPGTYSVQFTAPAGYNASPQDAGGDDAKDSDADAAGLTTAVTLAAGTNNLTVDAGFYGLASLGDFVWLDADRDGVQDPEELGLPGVTVQLLDSANAVVDTQTTGASGGYLFTNLTPGAYKVRFTAPAGYTASAADQGGDDAADSDVDGSGLTGAYTLAAGDNNLTVDAGFYAVASLGDFAWIDTDRDGVQDAGEPGLDGVTVTLLDSSGGTVAIRTTGSNGGYLFSDLAPGTYSVKFTAPAGYLASPQDAGGDDAKDSDADSSGETDTVTLAAGESNLTLDAGFYGVASLGDFAWNDLDRDGVQDAGEPGLEDVVVTLRNSGGATVATQTTGADGAYLFTNLAPGAYTVKFTAPAGYVASPADAGGDDNKDSDAGSGGVTTTYTLAAGQNNLTVDAGFYGLASLGDFAWNDVNRNGVQDSGEAGLSGVKVELLNGATVVATQTTAAGGAYLFTNVAPGTYTVRFTPPAGYVASPADAGSDDEQDSDASGGLTGAYTLAAGDNDLTVDAGFYAVASLGDLVWRDTDRDGVQDAGEAGISGVTVTLLDNSGATVATQTTNSNGGYLFTNLAPGTYKVRFGTVSGLEFTSKDAGGDDSKDSDADTTGLTGNYTLAAGDNITTVDAGLRTVSVSYASLGDFVWYDANRNGVQDSGESGLAGVTVQLLNTYGTVLSTQTTGSGGGYLFTNLAAGSYKVKFTPPAGYSASTADQGGDDTKDSDAGSGGVTGTYTLTAGQNNLTVDAGFYGNACLGDLVWFDADRDGVQDSGESGLAGVKVELLNSSGTVIATQTTSSSGAYSFSNLAPGSYSVKFTAPTGYSASPKDQGGDDTKDSDAGSGGVTGTYTLAAGQSNLTVDAGFYGTACLGNFAWHDCDRDGIQDSGESGLSGVKVELLNSSGAVIATQTTGSGGTYSFSNLAPGTYKVRFTPPAGYTASPKDQGSYDSKDSDADGSGVTGTYTLAAGDNNQTVDAGFFRAASLGDLAWVDTDKDGIQDSGEPGLAGVKVELLNSSGAVIATQTTGADGLYLFANIAPGNYRVRFTPPSGYSRSPQDRGYDGAKDSDADSSGLTGTVSLAAGDNLLTIDAGFYGSACLGDFVWFDCDRDGIQDSGESGLCGVKVELLDNSGAVIATQTTGSNGGYAFNNLTPGTYKVRFTAPAGYMPTAKDQGSYDSKDSDADGSGVTGTYTLAAGDSNKTVDAGFVQSGNLGDRVWLDADRDGVQDSGESGLAGVKVELLNSSGAVIATQTTSSSGGYLFTGLASGSYKVKFTAPSGYTAAPKDQGDDSKDSDADGSGLTGSISLAGGEDKLTIDAGFYGVACLGDFVWNDLDKDGIQDSGESGVNGVKVELLNSSGSVVATTTTSTSGAYSFTNLSPGSYKVRFTKPTGKEFTTQNAGGDDAKDSDVDGSGLTGTITLAAGDNNKTVDAGLKTAAAPVNVCIGDLVWLDSDGDGNYEPAVGEVGLNGVTVQLLNSGGSVVATTTTGDSPTVNPVTGLKDKGYYQFTNLASGTYTVKVVSTTLPSNLSPTFDLDGTGTPHRATASVTANRKDFDFGYVPNGKGCSAGVATIGYWKTHCNDWPVACITIGGIVYTKSEAIDILCASDNGDTRYTLAKQLIAAKLNVADGNPSGVIESTIIAADAYLAGVDLHPVRTVKTAWKSNGEALKCKLDDYNNGRLGVPHR